MTPRTNLVGRVFGRLTVVKFTGSKVDGKYRYAWECLCACGKTKDVLTSHLVSGAIDSCGCRKRTRDGRSGDPLFSVWTNMVNRCTDPENKSYADYGARGITIDPAWMDPVVFMDDMGPRPEGYTLEREDNDGPYSKDNCVWADRTTQANNKRNVPVLELHGQVKSVAQWARVYCMPAETLRSRLKAGWPISIAVGQIPTAR
jgi:hypothetical protein